MEAEARQKLRVSSLVPVLVEQMVNDTLVVTLSFGEKSYSGILLDCLMNKGPMKPTHDRIVRRIRSVGPLRANGSCCCISANEELETRESLSSRAHCGRLRGCTGYMKLRPIRERFILTEKMQCSLNDAQAEWDPEATGDHWNSGAYYIDFQLPLGSHRLELLFKRMQDLDKKALKYKLASFGILFTLCSHQYTSVINAGLDLS